ncbi:hypothetical protein [Mycolicibacterium sp. PDY-3]|uniref:hypothetical protein n=1 Tax=Mycolicibacterium sp. PDY-3 TaxID=3376069 RepID=UPI0037A78C4E
MNFDDMSDEQLASVERLTEIAFESFEWIDQHCFNDFDRGQMIRAVWFTLWGEDICDAR